MDNNKIVNKSDITGKPLSDNLSRFVDTITDELSTVLGKIAQFGGVWIVGGAVRDAAMGISPMDIDLATDLAPEMVLQLFPNSIKTGIEFGTVTVKSGRSLYQITTLRTEGNYHDNRRPDAVKWQSSLKADLERRDFTINSMAIDVGRRLFYDPHGGLMDIENRIIRSVGVAAKRISEDSLRILRAYRFLGLQRKKIWNFEPGLEKAINSNAFMLNNLPKERIWQEFRKILNTEQANKILIKMINNGILRLIFQREEKTQEKLLKALEKSAELDYISLLCLLNYDCQKPEIGEICRNLKMSNNDIKLVNERFQFIGYTPKNQISELRLFRFILAENWRQQLMLETILRSNSMIEYDYQFDGNYINQIFQTITKLKPLNHGKQLVDGNWIMNSTNIKQGQRLGRLKEWLYRLQIEKDLRTIDEIELLLCRINWHQDDFSRWPRLTLL